MSNRYKVSGYDPTLEGLQQESNRKPKFVFGPPAGPVVVVLYRIRRKRDGLYYGSGWSYTGHWKETPKFLTKAGLAQVKSSLKENEPKTEYVVETWSCSYWSESEP